MQRYASSPGAKIAAVVVTYQPTADVLHNVRRLAEQLNQVIVVDNGSTGAAVDVFNAIASLDRVYAMRNEVNLGIADAMNKGIRQALQDCCDWVATFDQDSAIPTSYFHDLLQACSKCPTATAVGMIVPGQWTTMSAATGSPAADFHFITAAPNSGCLIRTSLFQEVGFYDEAMFIDYVDVDFCLRVCRGGFQILSATRVVLEHSLGTQESRRILGRQIFFRVHNGWRYYYIMRNRIVTYGRHGLHFPCWILRDALWLPIEVGRIACLERERIHKLRCALHGLWDGLCGRQGRHPDYP